MVDDPTRRKLLADCDDSQRAAITSPDAPLLVVAGAGSGKTRVLTRRIAWRVVGGEAAPSHVLALTFTRKAAAELRERLAALGLSGPVAAGTFHAVALAQLRRRALDQHRALPVVLDSRPRLLARIVPEGFGGRAARGARREVIASISTEIDWAKARLISPEDYLDAAHEARRKAFLPAEDVAVAFTTYETEKRRRRVLDLDDLLARLAEEIARDGEFRAAQQWRFQHLFVDELQDANPAQLRLLSAWLGERRDLFAVGDARQAIYGWNGADPSAVTAFSERFPGAAVLRLGANYRSTPQVIAAASAVLGDEHGPVEAPRDDGVAPTLSAYATAGEEAQAVAALVRQAHRRGRRWSDCAVMARTNGQLGLLETALRELAIPVSAGTFGFLQRDSVRALLEPVARSEEPATFARWVADLRPGPPLPEDEDEDDDAELPMTQSAHLAMRERAALARLAGEYRDLDPLPHGRGFVAFLHETAGAEPTPEDEDAVELLTFHRAKGLEWPVVFVTGLEVGFVPISYADSEATLAEERRLLYVALSRAEDELHCSWARERTFGPRAVAREPSPFLTALSPVLTRLSARAIEEPDVVAAALAESRAALRRPLETIVPGRGGPRPRARGASGGAPQSLSPPVD